MTDFPWYTDEAAFKVIRRRWETTFSYGMETEEIDYQLFEILPLINRIPGVATYMSCASHPTNDPKFVWNNESKRKGSQFYVSLAATAEGANHLLKFFEVLSDTLDEMANDSHTQANWFKRSKCLTFLFTTHGQEPTEEHPEFFKWRGFCLKADMNRHDPDVQEYFLLVLKEALIHYLSHFVN